MRIRECCKYLDSKFEMVLDMRLNITSRIYEMAIPYRLPRSPLLRVTYEYSVDEPSISTAAKSWCSYHADEKKQRNV
jgi:hypothetical protein